MKKRFLNRTKLIGLSLPHKTTNEKGQSGIDCGRLWQQFETENYANKINGKLSDEIIAVYHQYDGDHTQPFAYFIGCPVSDDADPPPGMAVLTLHGGTYVHFTAKGRIPNCISDTWKKIGKSGINRNYLADFEVYGKNSHNWNDGSVDIYIGIHS